MWQPQWVECAFMSYSAVHSVQIDGKQWPWKWKWLIRLNTCTLHNKWGEKLKTLEQMTVSLYVCFLKVIYRYLRKMHSSWEGSSSGPSFSFWYPLGGSSLYVTIVTKDRMPPSSLHAHYTYMAHRYIDRKTFICIKQKVKSQNIFK